VMRNLVEQSRPRKMKKKCCFGVGNRNDLKEAIDCSLVKNR
jgi:hypothetical protein